MREIKFKFYPRKGYGTEPFIKKMNEMRLPSNATACYDICQYTGLKDKNGVEIYEFDKLQLANDEPFGDIEPNFIGTVKMIEGCWLVDNGFAAHKVWQEIAEWEVVGFEHPTLLIY